MGKVKKRKASSNKIINVRNPSGKRFKKLRQLKKKGRRSFSDSAFSNSYLPETMTSTPVPSVATKKSKKTRRKEWRRDQIKALEVPTLLYKFRNDHMLVNSGPPEDAPGMSVTATASKCETEEKLMDTIVIDDEEEVVREGEPSESSALSIIEQVGEEMLDLVSQPSEGDDQDLVVNPLHEQSEEGEGQEPNIEQVTDDEIIVVEEKKSCEVPLTLRNLKTMTRLPGPTAPDFIPLLSGRSQRNTRRLKEKIFQHTRAVGRSLRDRRSYRDVVGEPRPPPPPPARRPERPEPIVAVGPTMMASTDSTAGVKGSLRPIVLDGCNVAKCHGMDKKFSVRGLVITVEFFVKRGHTKVVAFLPQEKCRFRSRDEREALEKLREEGHLVYTPSRQFNNEVISSYDDTFVLDYAAQHGAVVITRDNYRDLTNKKPEWDLVIRERILMPTFVGDDIMWPHDPLGRNGSSLDDFLKF